MKHFMEYLIISALIRIGDNNTDSVELGRSTPLLDKETTNFLIYYLLRGKNAH